MEKQYIIINSMLPEEVIIKENDMIKKRSGQSITNFTEDEIALLAKYHSIRSNTSFVEELKRLQELRNSVEEEKKTK